MLDRLRALFTRKSAPFDRPAPPLECPYCGLALADGGSRDHVLPEFLGGRTQIPACRKCNNTIGTRIEGVIARETFKPFSLHLRAIGLEPAVVAARWPKALEHEGRIYDLVPSPNGVRPELSNSSVDRDADGNIVGGRFKTKSELEHFERRMTARNKRVIVEEVHDGPTSTKGMVVSFHSSDQLHRAVLKMAVAASTLLRCYVRQRVAAVAPYIVTESESEAPIVLRMFDETPTLDALRVPLSHLVYVEWNARRAYAVVQFFGAYQYFVDLDGEAPGSKADALLLTLDPISGHEVVRSVAPLDLACPPEMSGQARAEDTYIRIFEKFEREAIARGAVDGRLEFHSVDFESDLVDDEKP